MAFEAACLERGCKVSNSSFQHAETLFHDESLSRQEIRLNPELEAATRSYFDMERGVKPHVGSLSHVSPG